MRVVSVDMDVPRWSARDLEVISGLRRLGDTATPDAATRDRIRTQVLDRLAEQERRAPSRRRRVLAEVLAAAVALVIALGGLGLVLSKNALPGDPLYGVKRVGESAQLGLTFGDSAKAQRHLEYAANRLDELAALHSTDAAPYEAALAGFRSEAAQGVAQFTALAVQGGGQLTELQSWSEQQRAKLADAQQALPAGALPSYDSSTALLGRIDTRAQQLAARLNCFQITTPQPDDLGPVPASGPCQPPADANTGTTPGAVPLPLPARPSAQPAAPATTTPGAQGVPPESHPTNPLAPSGGVSAPPAVSGPVTAPTSPQPSTTTSAPPPLISLPPLLPGLPGVGIG